MADDNQPGPMPGRKATAAGGVLAGAGLSTGLFGTIGMSKILAAPTGYSTAYPVVVFCLAALFLLTAALMTIRISGEQRVLAYVGMGCFALVAVVGVSIIFWQDFRAPTITVTEMFDPDFTSNPSAAPKLQLLYRSVGDGAGDYAPYKNNPLSIRSGDVIAFRMDGLSDLVQNYKFAQMQSQTQTRLLMNACKGQTNLVCQQIGSLDAPVQ